MQAASSYRASITVAAIVDSQTSTPAKSSAAPLHRLRKHIYILHIDHSTATRAVPYAPTAAKSSAAPLPRRTIHIYILHIGHSAATRAVLYASTPAQSSAPPLPRRAIHIYLLHIDHSTATSTVPYASSPAHSSTAVSYKTTRLQILMSWKISSLYQRQPNYESFMTHLKHDQLCESASPSKFWSL